MNNERNRVNSMIHLRDHMKLLFELIGIEPKHIAIRPLPKILALLELILKDNALYDYLETLDADCVRAIEIIKKRNLSDWNQKKLMQKYSALKEEANELKQQNEKLRMRNAAEAEKAAQSEETLRNQQLLTVRELISLSDAALNRKAWVEEFAPDNHDAKRVAAAQLNSVRRLLEKMGAEILEDTGLYDCRLHMVMGTIPTSKVDLANHIAETVRPGYRFGNEAIRPQEVIIYTLDGGET